MAEERSLVVPVVGALALLVGAAVLLWGPSAEAPRPPTPTPARPAPGPSPSTSPEPAPAPVVAAGAPRVTLQLPTRTAKSPVTKPADPALQVSRQILQDIVDHFGKAPDNPWAVGHALLAEGSAMKLADGKDAIPFLYETYGQKTQMGDDVGVTFPRSRGETRIEPHSDLFLKMFGELGVPPDSHFVVEGEPVTFEQHYQQSLARTWVDERGRSSFPDLSDAPWALQGLATYAPADLEWTSQDGHPMSLDLFTDIVVADLWAQTRFMAEAKAKGLTVEKQRQGIFAYTCGGAHSIQGAGYAVARGYGSALSKDRMAEQIEILFWRYDVELAIIDRYLQSNPEYAPLLLDQRLKFLGHFLETTHKFAAMKLFVPTPEQEQTMSDARDELSKTVQTIAASKLVEELPNYKVNNYQLYLDFIGDSAHAIRAIDLSTGAGDVTY